MQTIASDALGKLAVAEAWAEAVAWGGTFGVRFLAESFAVILR